MHLTVDDDHAADVARVHQADGLVQRHVRRAADGLMDGQLTDTGFQGIVFAQAFHRAQLRLLVDLVEQAADPAHGELAEFVRNGHQLDEGRLVQQQAEGVLGRQVRRAGGALAHQRGHREALADDDLEGGFGTALGGMRALPVNAALLDDVEVFDRAIVRGEDALAFGIKTQLAVFHEIGEMHLFHLVEGRVLAQKLHGAVDVLQHRRLPGLGEGVSFAHGSPSVFWTWCAAEGSGHIGRKSSPGKGTAD